MIKIWRKEKKEIKCETNVIHYLEIILIHRGWNNMATISQMTLSNAFSWMKMLEFKSKFHWSLFLRVQLTIDNMPTLVQIMAWFWPGDKPLSGWVRMRGGGRAFSIRENLSWIIQQHLDKTITSALYFGVRILYGDYSTFWTRNFYLLTQTSLIMEC